MTTTRDVEEYIKVCDTNNFILPIDQCRWLQSMSISPDRNLTEVEEEFFEIVKDDIVYKNRRRIHIVNY